jgi:hypothetical protein
MKPIRHRRLGDALGFGAVAGHASFRLEVCGLAGEVVLSRDAAFSGNQ